MIHPVVLSPAAKDTLLPVYLPLLHLQLLLVLVLLLHTLAHEDSRH